MTAAHNTTNQNPSQSMCFKTELDLLRKVAERQTQLICGDNNKKLADFSRDVRSLDQEALQMLTGLGVQFLQEENLNKLEKKIRQFNKRGMSRLGRIGMVDLLLGMANDEVGFECTAIPFELKMFYHEIEDDQPDDMNRKYYKPITTQDELLDALPFQNAMMLYQALKRIHTHQRFITSHIAPSDTANSTKQTIANTAIRQKIEQFTKFSKQSKDNIEVNQKEISESCVRNAYVQDLRRKLLYECGEFGNKYKLPQQRIVNELKRVGMFRNGFKDAEEGIQKIKDKFGNQEPTDPALADRTIDQRLLESGLCYEGDMIEQIISYEDGRRAYRPMTLKEVSRQQLQAKGIYTIGELKGKESEWLRINYIRPGYPYNQSETYMWQQYRKGCRVDVISSVGNGSEWIEGFVVKQSVDVPQVVVEIPNYCEFEKGQEIVINNLEQIRMSMDFVVDTWEVRSIRSLVRELSNYPEKQWWKQPFPQRITDCIVGPYEEIYSQFKQYQEKWYYQ
eukprot:TRINITY_DN843_c0_g1_i5.p1 TRINITY_DN843_c0_g1~~TRINITY_DN843_c0_g1_i5.p1  ORF type:complete len:507 (+),score=52.10 TRINITY_DN843_c0_g1_i5:144-1664(+)